MSTINTKDLHEGGIIREAGNSATYKTGDWRTFVPRFVEENCIHCMFCWIYCPDTAVTVKDEKMTGFNYDHCKGCGVCAMECPGKKGNKAIVMEEEGK